MEISFEMDSLEELEKKVELLASGKEIDKTNRTIFQRSADLTEPKMKARIPKSTDNSKSGKVGYRPPGHAADNIPKSVSSKRAIVGWKLNGDAQNWFYMKFVEWGTSKMPPQDFVENTKQECEGQYYIIAEQEYQKTLDRLLGD